VISPPRVELYTAPFCALQALTGGRSAPQIVLDGRPIGGFDELAALDRHGRLAPWASAEWTAIASADR
jgi:hypothetical protein